MIYFSTVLFFCLTIRFPQCLRSGFYFLYLIFHAGIVHCIINFIVGYLKHTFNLNPVELISFFQPFVRAYIHRILWEICIKVGDIFSLADAWIWSGSFWVATSHWTTDWKLGTWGHGNVIWRVFGTRKEGCFLVIIFSITFISCHMCLLASFESKSCFFFLCSVYSKIDLFL